MKKISLLIVLYILLFTACTTINNVNNSYIDVNGTVVPKYDPITPNIPQITQMEFSQKYECEQGKISGNVKIGNTIKDVSKGGYIEVMENDNDNNFTQAITVPSTQHYNITLCASSPYEQINFLKINNEEVKFTISSETFSKIQIKNIFLKEGENTLSFSNYNIGMKVDYIEITNSTEIYNLEIKPTRHLINTHATEKAKKLMHFLYDNFGKNLISGQYASPGTNDELDLIYNITGKYPAIRMGDLSSYSLSNTNEADEISRVIEWDEKGGINSLSWYWNAPLNEPYFYANETSFDLSKAVTEKDIATLSIDDITILYKNGEISEECLAIIKDIDNISKELLILAENEIPIIWRPLSEAGGQWFWWGSSGSDAYKWLWDLLYTRQTEYHKLNNLIWVWNGQVGDYYVGDEKCDIISMDIYNGNNDYSSQINSYLNMSKFSKNKLIAISECGNIPSMENIIRDKANWSFFGTWYGEYIKNENDQLNTQYISSSLLIKYYNYVNIITLDKI